jgi:hypothetical protein
VNLSRYRKTFAALVGSLLTWFNMAYVPDGVIDRAEWYALAVALAGPLGVWAVTNATVRQEISDVPLKSGPALEYGTLTPAPDPWVTSRMPPDETWAKKAAEPQTAPL